MNPPDTRISNSHSTSNRERIQENFLTLPLFCRQIIGQFESIFDGTKSGREQAVGRSRLPLGLKNLQSDPNPQ